MARVLSHDRIRHGSRSLPVPDAPVVERGAVPTGATTVRRARRPLAAGLLLAIVGMVLVAGLPVVLGVHGALVAALAFVVLVSAAACLVEAMEGGAS